MAQETMGTRLLVPLDEVSATGQQFRAQAPQIAEQVRVPLQATEQTHGLSWSGQAREQYLTLHQPLVQALDHVQARVGTLGTQLGHHASYYAVLNAMRFGGTPGAPAVEGGLEPTEDERVAGNVPTVVNADPANPRPYNITSSLPPGLQAYGVKVAQYQHNSGGKWETYGGARVQQTGMAPFETPIKQGNALNGHAEAQTIESVVSNGLHKSAGKADVDLVTENLPCPDRCTPSVLYNQQVPSVQADEWYSKLQNAAGPNADVHFRVWHHGMGVRVAGAPPVQGDLTLYSYELPPLANGQRQLYISPEMYKKMNWTKDGLRKPGFAPWTPATGVPFDDSKYYMELPPNVSVVSQGDLEQLLSTMP